MRKTREAEGRDPAHGAVSRIDRGRFEVGERSKGCPDLDSTGQTFPTELDHVSFNGRVRPKESFAVNAKLGFFYRI